MKELEVIIKQYEGKNVGNPVKETFAPEEIRERIKAKASRGQTIDPLLENHLPYEESK